MGTDVQAVRCQVGAVLVVSQPTTAAGSHRSRCLAGALEV